jgi:hypothetical protein
MPFCKTCGTFYPKSLGVCPSATPTSCWNSKRTQYPPARPEAEYALKKRRWIAIIVGLPMLIGFIYGIYYIVKLLQP